MVTTIGPNTATPIAYPPGTNRTEWQPGDIILTRDPKGFFSWLIRFGQRLRYRGDDKKYAWFNHVAVVVDTDGTLVEALSRGIVQTNGGRYDEAWYAYIDTDLSDYERARVAQYANRVAELNTKYGWMQIVAISLSLLTNSVVQFSVRGQNICSGFAAEALRAGGYWFEVKGQIASSSFLNPADLAHAFHTELIETKA